MTKDCKLSYWEFSLLSNPALWLYASGEICLCPAALPPAFPGHRQCPWWRPSALPPVFRAFPEGSVCLQGISLMSLAPVCDLCCYLHGLREGPLAAGCHLLPSLGLSGVSSIMLACVWPLKVNRKFIWSFLLSTCCQFLPLSLLR